MGLASYGISSDELWAPTQVDACGQARLLLTSCTRVCLASTYPALPL